MTPDRAAAILKTMSSQHRQWAFHKMSLGAPAEIVRADNWIADLLFPMDRALREELEEGDRE